MTRSEGGYVIKINGRKVLGTMYGGTIENVIKHANRVSEEGDEVKIYVEMIRDDLDVIDFGDPDHVELKLLHTVGEEADEIVIETPEAALTLALKLAIQMSTELRDIIDLLIVEGHWDALDDICKVYGSDVYDYVRRDEDCPW